MDKWIIRRHQMATSHLGMDSCHGTQNTDNTSRPNICSTPIPEFEGHAGLNSYEDLYRFSCQEPDKFWGTLARSRLSWYEDFTQVHDCDFSQGKSAWFIDGKINVSVNCVDRHYQENPDRVALIWEKDQPGAEEYITYRELYKMMNQLANTLRRHGVRRGHIVVLYLPTCPLAVASMLACARIGAIHNVVFAGFSSQALASRIQDARAQVIITMDQGMRGGRTIELKKTVDAAITKCPTVRQVFVAKRTGVPVPFSSIDIQLEEAMMMEATTCEPEVMDSEDILLLLYTSGSTGRPKGVVHTQAGYLLFAMVTHQMVFDYREGDVFGCVADIGWITGHSYVVYGPLCNGATTVLFESVPTFPDPGRYWETIARLGITQFYCAPTALRLLLKYPDTWVTSHNRSSLRTLGSVGEPLNHEAWQWYHDVVGNGRCPVVDTWWQTETGGILISPRPSAPGAEIVSSMPMRPFFGIEPVLLDEKGRQLTEVGDEGALCIRCPWPGLARSIYGDHQRYIDTYFKPYTGTFFTGDGARRHVSGYLQITGRVDDVINVSGHRLGTAEIEDVIDEHPAIAETAVVGYPHNIKGEGVYAYITLKEGVTESPQLIISELRALVKSKIASYAVPEIVQLASSLPKTRSGKLMRRILHQVAAGKSDKLGDTSSLADPSVVQSIITDHQQLLIDQQTWKAAQTNISKPLAKL